MNCWNFYTTNEIKPQGWLKRQLILEARGLCGNLDKIWPDVRDSAWIGGTREGWERVPYWLDGFIPLAYLLGNEDMIKRAKKYIDAILSRQNDDGWICPCSYEKRSEYDTWAVLLITKVLKVYYDCSGDERIPDAIYKALKNYYVLLKSGQIKLFNWGEFRWYEGFIALQFIYDKYREPWMKELAKILKEQGVDYETLGDKWVRPLNKWSYETHVVNLAMMLKYEAVSAELLGDNYKDIAEKLYTVLYEHNGTAVGTFTGDECLSGLSAIQGTELCSVVELMYSYELLYAYTGDDKWAERLEKVAFNALPATISDDMWTHQYVQQSNQIACEKFPGKSIFRTNNEEAHLFGLEPHFGCCTSNFGQGWPKLTLSAYMHKDNKIISALPLPSYLETDKAKVLLETEYPFKNSLHYYITAMEDFEFSVRLPSFAKNVTVNGKASDKDTEFALKKSDKTEITIDFDVYPSFAQRPYGLNTVEYGSLVFSLPIKSESKMYEYVKNGVERKFPYCDYELLAQNDWNYAFSDSKLTLEEKETGEVPFSSEHPPLIIKAKAKKINWGLEDGYESVCAKVPMSKDVISGEEEITLYPYGCAKLRMTEMPLI